MFWNGPVGPPGLNPIEDLWNYLKRTVHRRAHHNLTDVAHFARKSELKLPNQDVLRLLILT